MDSAVALAEARALGFAVHALTVRYGQRHAAELAAAERVARALGAVEQRVVAVDLAALGGSALLGSAAVPKDREAAQIAAGPIPATYVPARNALFLTLALGWAETLGARDLFLGVNALDYSGYPDCRPAFVSAFEALANVATRAADGGPRFRVHAPLIAMSKAEIIRRGVELGVDYGLTHSCYDPVGRGAPVACGRCDACLLRKKGFAEAGVPDPTRYAPE
jgi:7-cyano-7-deazaguanine synthase